MNAQNGGVLGIKVVEIQLYIRTEYLHILQKRAIELKNL